MVEYFILVACTIAALFVIRRHTHRQRERDREEMRRHVIR